MVVWPQERQSWQLACTVMMPQILLLPLHNRWIPLFYCNTHRLFSHLLQSIPSRINISEIAKTNKLPIAGLVVGKKPCHSQCRDNSINWTSKEGGVREAEGTVRMTQMLLLPLRNRWIPLFYYCNTYNLFSHLLQSIPSTINISKLHKTDMRRHIPTDPKS